jgi:hypothetical protein
MAAAALMFRYQTHPALISALAALLDSPALNRGELDPETQSCVENARRALAIAQGGAVASPSR